jgi:hypothetical protein
VRLFILVCCAGCYNVDSLSQHADDAGADLNMAASHDLGNLDDLSSPDLSTMAVSWNSLQSGTSNHLRALAADGDTLWVAGANSTVLKIAADDKVSKKDPGPGFNLRGAASTAGDLWLVGDDGALLTRTAGGFLYSAMENDTLYAAFGLGAGDVVNVGSGGHFDRNLNPEETGVFIALFAVWGRSIDDLFAVGEGGTIIHRTADGGVPPWTALTSSTLSDLHGLSGSGSTLLATGASGVVLRSDDGTNWSAEASGSTADLFGVWLSGSEAFAVGGNGTILHRTGGVWTVEHTGGSTLRAVIGRSVTDVWAVGDDGTILHRQP